jgi:hypothetical protein
MRSHLRMSLFLFTTHYSLFATNASSPAQNGFDEFTGFGKIHGPGIFFF